MNPDRGSDDEVTFTLQENKVDWATRGQSIDAAAEIPTIGVYAVRNYGTENSTQFIDNKMGVQMENDKTQWHFSPSLFYPYGETLKFFAYSPYGTGNENSGDGNGITTSFDKDAETMTIDYLAPTLDSRNQPDILVASGIGNKDNSGELQLDYAHALTKITLSAKLKSAPVATLKPGSTTEKYTPRYYITRFTMQNVATEGTLTCTADNTTGKIAIGDADNDSGPWIIDQPSRGPVIASNAYILPDPTGTYPDKGDEDEAVELNNTSYQNVMLEDQALFMLPQRIETLPTEVYSKKPTIFITIYEAETDTYYRTSEMELKTPNGKRFEMGEYINYNFEFDIDDAGTVIDMSLVPEMKEWDDREIDVDIDPNIYLVLDDNFIVDNKVILYTNSATTPEVTSLTPNVKASVTNGIATGNTPGSHTIGDAKLTAYTITFSGIESLSNGDKVQINVVGYADGSNTEDETTAGKPNETKITKEFNLTIK